MEQRQIAVQAELPASITVTGITAYVGMKDNKVRYAIYRDAGGEPGALVAETGTAKSSKDAMAWLTLPLSLDLDAGTYWLALAFEDKNQHYAYASSGGNARVVSYDAVKDGFRSTWGSSASSSSEQISIFVNFDGDDADELRLGDTTVHPTLVTDVEQQQIATRLTMPEDGTLLSITAYVGDNDKDVRYAIYADSGGEPGALLAETLTDVSAKTMGWLTLLLPDTPLTAGYYWLALSMEDKDQAMAVAATGGTTRYRSGEAYKDDFLSSWGGSSRSTTEQISIYGTYTTTPAPVLKRGFRVDSQWLDSAGRPIAPHLFGAGGDGRIEFEIVDQMVIPAEEFAVEVRVLGAAIQTGSDGYHMPVTMRLLVGGSVFEPFGPYLDAVTGNLNDDQTVTCNSNGTNPRCSVLTGTFSAGTEVRVDGRSWKKNGSGSDCSAGGWSLSREASTADNDVQLKVLRNGDPVPDIQALYAQASIGDYVGEFVDLDTGLMQLGENQVIYLFELGSSGNSSGADFQDLVVLVTLAENGTGLCGATPTVSTSLCGSPFADVAGSATSAGDIDASGGITSADTFSQWFAASLGVNLGMAHPITLNVDAMGVYDFSTTSFFPIDKRGLGNEGDSHNYFFTYMIPASFVYEQCGGQFIEFEGSDDAWLFVNGKLAMDLGGMMPGTRQVVDMDRLGLVDGEQYEVRFFYAQRQTISASFHLRTNIPLLSKRQLILSGSFD